MKTVRKLIVYLVLLLSIGFVAHVEVSEASSANFSVRAIPPETQQNKEASYFDLILEKDQTEALVIEVTNASSEEIVVEVSLNTASTNTNGVIDYGLRKSKLDESIQYSFEELASLKEPTLTLAPQEKKNISIEVTMPDRNFNGILLGGINISEKETENVEEGTIENRFSYSVGVVLSNENREVKPFLDYKGTTTEQRNRRNFIVASIANQAAMIMNHLVVEANIYKGNQMDPIYSQTTNDMRMAPNSILEYGIRTNEKKIAPGKYRIELTATSGEDSWSWEDTFEITRTEADKLNETAVDLNEDYLLWYVAGGLGLVILILIALLTINYRKNKK